MSWWKRDKLPVPPACPPHDLGDKPVYRNPRDRSELWECLGCTRTFRTEPVADRVEAFLREQD